MAEPTKRADAASSSCGYRPSNGLMGYAWLRPFQIEWGDGWTLRIGQRFYIAAKFRIRWVR